MLDNLTNYAFFSLINEYLRNEIDIFQWDLLQRTTAWVGVIALTALTFWILIQGYRVATGQLKESAMSLVVTSLRATLIIAVATSMAMGSSQLYWTMTDGVSNAISKTVSGESASPYQQIDKNLAMMQVAMGVIDQLQTGGDAQQEQEKSRARWFSGLGMAGPGVIAGSMLLLNKIAIALFVGFGPLFILALLFQPTKQLFNRWLLYGIGTVFSLAVLNVMVALTMKLIGAVAAAFLVKWAVSSAGWDTGEGISSMALQQGGIGLVMSTLIISTPPMAAAFFQGTLGQFSAYSAMGALERGGQPAGAGGAIIPNQPHNNSNVNTAPTSSSGRGAGVPTSSDDGSTGRMGNAR
jgi:type IV secretion system protein VirB6